MQQNVFDRKALLKWAVPLATGFVVVLLGFTLYQALHPNYPKQIVEMANDLQIPPQEAQELYTTFLKVASGATPTDDQWQAIQRLVESDNIPRKRRALLMLGGLYKTKYRQQAIHYAEGLVNSTDSHVKALSVSVLAKLHDSRWKEYALQNRNSPDPILRSSATALLERQDRFK